MRNDIIQAEYDKLEDIAGRFAANAEATVEMRSRIENAVQALQNGNWEGEGSTAFFTEMNQDVFPVMIRLTTALEQAQSVTFQAKAILQAAEEEAARPFSTSNTATKERGHIVPASGTVGVTDPDITNSSYYDQAVKNIKNSFWNPFDGNDFSYDSQEEYEWLLRREIALEEHKSKKASASLLGPFESIYVEGGEIVEDVFGYFGNDKQYRRKWEQDHIIDDPRP